ncbi:MAG: hypothetical protein R3C09_12130 [Pirellulaceae bacterium]
MHSQLVVINTLDSHKCEAAVSIIAYQEIGCRADSSRVNGVVLGDTWQISSDAEKQFRKFVAKSEPLCVVPIPS